MVDVNDDAKAGFRRIEVLTGPGRRRRGRRRRRLGSWLRHWSQAHECQRWHGAGSFARNRCSGGAGRRGWICLINSGAGTCSLPPFVPLVAAPAAKVAIPTPPSITIEIKLAGAAVRVVCGVDGELLTAVLRAVRCSSGGT